MLSEQRRQHGPVKGEGERSAVVVTQTPCGLHFLCLHGIMLRRKEGIMALVSRIVLLICLFFLICTAQTDRVIDEALKPSPVADNLRRLTDEIGGRIPGTPAAQQ